VISCSDPFVAPRIADREYLVGTVTTRKSTEREGWQYLYDNNTQVGIFFGEFLDKKEGRAITQSTEVSVNRLSSYRDYRRYPYAV